jgi:hypothetical protein
MTDVDFDSIAFDLAGVVDCLQKAFGRTFPDLDPSSLSPPSLPSLVRVASLLLAFTVQSHKKADHINAILALPEDIQMVLMETIENVLTEVGGGDEEEDEEDDGATDENEAPAAASPATRAAVPTPAASAAKVAGMTSPTAG